MKQNDTIRVLHVVTKMRRAGLESRLMDIYRNIDRDKVQFDFLTHRIENGDYDEEIRSLGGNVYHLQPIKPWRFISYLKSLDRFFLSHKYYRITHVHLNTYSGWVQLIAKKNGIPIRITHSRNTGIDKDWKMPFKLLSKTIINLATTHRLACSKEAGEWLFGKREVMVPNNLIVVPNGFNIEKFAFSMNKRSEMRKKIGLKEERAFVHIGRLEKQKNHMFLIDVFDRICKHNPNSKFFFFGDGNLKVKIEKKIKKLNLTDKCFFMESVPNIYDYMQAMDAMVFPSFYEGFPTVLLECQCNGLPVLASETITHNVKQTPCLEFMSFKNDSTETWAKKILSMMSSIERTDRSEIIKEAGYDISDTYKVLQDFYISVMNEH